MLLEVAPAVERGPVFVRMEDDRLLRGFAKLAAVVPVLWLGEVVIVSISRRVSAICSALQLALRQWSVNFMSRRLLSIMVAMNPHLSFHQQHLLLGITARAVEHLLWQRSFDPQVMRGIVALACPNRNTSSFLTYLVDVIASLTEGVPLDDDYDESQSDLERCEESSQMDMDVDLEAGEATPMVEESLGEDMLQVVVESTTLSQNSDMDSCSKGLIDGSEGGEGGGSTAMVVENERGQEVEEASTSGNWDQLGIFRAQEEDAAVVQMLVCYFCMETVYIADMPPKVRRAVLETLWGGTHVRQILCKNGSRKLGTAHGPRRPTSPPICSITLEPLLLPNWTMPEDVVAVIQRHNGKKMHAFLYRGRALYGWLRAAPTPTNPGTRSWVLPTDIYRLS